MLGALVEYSRVRILPLSNEMRSADSLYVPHYLGKSKFTTFKISPNVNSSAYTLPASKIRIEYYPILKKCTTDRLNVFVCSGFTTYDLI